MKTIETQIPELLKIKEKIESLKIGDKNLYIYDESLFQFKNTFKETIFYDLYFIDKELYNYFEKSEICKLIKSNDFTLNHTLNQENKLFKVDIDDYLNYFKNDIKDFNINLKLELNDGLNKVLNFNLSGKNLIEMNNHQAKSIGINFMYVFASEINKSLINLFKEMFKAKNKYDK